jgi:hypothetical protein
MHDISTRPGVAPLLEPRARITVTATAESTVVAVAGELDLAVTGRLAAQLDEELGLAPRSLVIDLTRLAFCAARGLTVVLEAVAIARSGPWDSSGRCRCTAAWPTPTSGWRSPSSRRSSDRRPPPGGHHRAEGMATDGPGG